jgi:hypothetical protein
MKCFNIKQKIEEDSFNVLFTLFCEESLNFPLRI